MPKTESLTKANSPRRFAILPRFRFSLAWLMIAIAVVAVALGLSSLLGSAFELVFYVIFLFVRCVVPTPLVICIIYGRGYARAFAIGALMPWVLIFPWEIQRHSLTILLLTLGISMICGIVAASTWRWLRRSDIR